MQKGLVPCRYISLGSFSLNNMMRRKKNIIYSVKKTVLCSIVFVFFPSIMLAQSLNTTVYICTNQGTKYHVSKNCKYLGHCRYTPEPVTLQEAIDGQKTNNGLVSFTYCKGCSKRLAGIEMQYRNGESSSPSSSASPSRVVQKVEVSSKSVRPTSQKSVPKQDAPKKVSKKVKIGNYSKK